MKRETVSSAAEVAGSAAIVGGTSMLSVAAGLIVAGVAILAFSWRATS